MAVTPYLLMAGLTFNEPNTYLLGGWVAAVAGAVRLGLEARGAGSGTILATVIVASLVAVPA